MSKAQIVLAATALLSFAPGALAQDAYTVRQSDTRVKLRVSLPVGGPATITTIDGELSSVESGNQKIGISARILDRDKGTVEIRLWKLTRGRNGAEAIRSLEQAETRVGEAIATGDAVRDVVTSVEVIEILDRQRGDRDYPSPCSDGTGKRCVSCSGRTACS